MSHYSRARLAFIVTVVLVSIIATAHTMYWKTYVWLPTFVYEEFLPKKTVPDSKKHLLFVMVDHFEPGFGARGDSIATSWLADFRPIASRHFDSYGNRFRYTWFYPYDHKNTAVLRRLSRMSFDDYGEIDLHWHHPQTDNAGFALQLTEAIEWFGKFGCFRLMQPGNTTAFGFIHGSWALDDSREWISGGHKRRCGVNLELDILRQEGCFGDFTMPALSTTSQPKQVNSIYYAKDSPARKSYDIGVPAQVGQSHDDLFMLLTGPIGYNWQALDFEYGAVESYALPTTHRINYWIDRNIHVLGRPEWVFVKVYSHGTQSSKTILGRELDPMLSDLEAICRDRGIRLHYLTAREAFNCVKAAEDGLTGDPEQYRNYRIGQRCDQVFHSDMPVTIRTMSPDSVWIFPDSIASARYEFKIKGLSSVEGAVREILYVRSTGELKIDALGTPTVVAGEGIMITGGNHSRVEQDPSRQH